MRSMRYFIAVCEYGNVTQAAEKLHISQPALSHALRELEDEYKVSLFQRSRKKMILTEKGRFLWEKADEIMDKLNELDIQMGNMCQSKLRIGISPVIKEIVSVQIFPKFCEKNQDIRVYITTVGSHKGKEMVQDGELDMVFIIADQTMDEDLMQYELGHLSGSILREQVNMDICLVWRKGRIIRKEEKQFVEYVKKISHDT